MLLLSNKIRKERGRWPNSVHVGQRKTNSAAEADSESGMSLNYKWVIIRRDWGVLKKIERILGI